MLHRERRGFVLITMLFSTLVLVAFLGLAIDTGYMELVKTRMQTAADAAALAGSQEILRSGTSGMDSAARVAAAANGFTHGSNGVTVTVHSPPTSGYSTADGTGVEVLIAQSVDTLFVGVVGTGPVNVKARAVARQGPGTSCIHVLDTSSDGAFSSSGGGDVKIDCGVVVESGAPAALTITGGTKVSAANFAVWGGVSLGNGSKVTPTPVGGIRGPGDPLAHLTPPAVGACDYTDTRIKNQTVTLPPGVYCNGITLGTGANVTFSPAGTYILKGGGLGIESSTNVHGAGVIFYNTAATGYAFKPINIKASANVTLSAPTTGSYSGILVFQDRSITSTLVNAMYGGSDTIWDGSIYMPSGILDFSGGSDASLHYSIIVVKKLSFSGGTKVHNDYSTLPNGSPLRVNAVVSE